MVLAPLHNMLLWCAHGELQMEGVGTSETWQPAAGLHSVILRRMLCDSMILIVVTLNQENQARIMLTYII
jgi:hypothetical protein